MSPERNPLSGRAPAYRDEPFDPPFALRNPASDANGPAFTAAPGATPVSHRS